jgi:hypothetical protein
MPQTHTRRIQYFVKAKQLGFDFCDMLIASCGLEIEYADSYSFPGSAWERDVYADEPECCSVVN